MIRGRAVPTTVWSSAARNTATMTAPRTRIRTGWGSTMGGRSTTSPQACVVGLDTEHLSARFVGCPEVTPSIRSIPCLMTVNIDHDVDLVEAPPAALAAPDAARLDRLGAGRPARGQPAHDPQRHRAV